MIAAPASSLRKLLSDCIALLLLAALPALLAGWLHPKRPALSWTRPGVAEVSLREIESWSGQILWVDARTEDVYRKQHVPGAISLNESGWEQQLPNFIEAWQPNLRIVVYCDSTACDASQAVALRLQRELKLTDIHVLKEGWAAWQKAHP